MPSTHHPQMTYNIPYNKINHSNTEKLGLRIYQTYILSKYPNWLSPQNRKEIQWIPPYNLLPCNMLKLAHYFNEPV